MSMSNRVYLKQLRRVRQRFRALHIGRLEIRRLNVISRPGHTFIECERPISQILHLQQKRCLIHSDNSRKNQLESLSLPVLTQSREFFQKHFREKVSLIRCTAVEYSVAWFPTHSTDGTPLIQGRRFLEWIHKPWVWLSELLQSQTRTTILSSEQFNRITLGNKFSFWPAPTDLIYFSGITRIGDSEYHDSRLEQGSFFAYERKHQCHEWEMLCSWIWATAYRNELFFLLCS